MNTFGQKFKLSIFGESHAPKLGIEISGCPSGIGIRKEDFKQLIERRKSGKEGTTKRTESDVPKILSGIVNGLTNGEVIRIEFDNVNIHPEHYTQFKEIPRPGHADLTARQRYGDEIEQSGGGIFSGRMTLPLVAAGVIAMKTIPSIQFKANVISVNGSTDIENEVKKALDEGDSIGGIVECIVTGVPAGLGDPFFNSVESMISHLAFSIPGIKGIEFGSGFESAIMKGSDHNDPIIDIKGKTLSNFAGGINGGITNGNDIIFRVAIKPASSIARQQKSINIKTGIMETFSITGRHDTCIALRVPPVIEAIAAIVLADVSIK